MDSYLTLPISERKLQELVADAKDFVYGLGKEFENIFFLLQVSFNSLNFNNNLMSVKCYVVCKQKQPNPDLLIAFKF